MTIPCNKNLTKQLNNYSYVIAITLLCLLQRTKQTLNILIVICHGLLIGSFNQSTS